MQHDVMFGMGAGKGAVPQVGEYITGMAKAAKYGRKDLVGAPAHNKVDGIPYCDT